MRCKTRAVASETCGAILRKSSGCCFSSRNSVAEFVAVLIGGLPETA